MTTTPPLSKRDQIVQAARKLFLKSGFETTSMDALAAEAGVSKRTVYSHFENKETLFAAIMGALCNETGCTQPRAISPDAPPEEALHAFARDMLKLDQSPEERSMFRVVLAEVIQFPKLAEIFWNNGPELSKQILTVYLEKQIKRGVLVIDDPATAAKQFIGMIKWPHSMPELFGIDSQATDSERQVALDQAIAIFLKGTRAK